MEDIMRFSQVVTEKMKSIFGEDLIDRVYIIRYLSAFNSESNSIKELAAEVKSAELNCDPNDEEMRWDGQEMLVVFSNGRMVRFSNSEWAYFEPVKELYREV